MEELITRANKKGVIYKGLILYLFLVIFTPYIKIGGRDNFEITFVLTLVFVLSISSVVKKYREVGSRVLNQVLGIMIGIFVLDGISIVNFIRIKGMENIVSNSVPNIKVLLYILLVMGFYSLVLDETEQEHFLYRVVPIFGAVVALIGIMQHYNFMGFNDWFTKYYISSESGRVLIDVLRDKQEWSRVLGTLSNPNFYSLEIIIFIVFMISNIIFSNSNKNKIVNVIIAVLLFITLIFTQSRTGLVALVGVCFYIMLLQIIKGGRKNILKYLLISIGVVLLSLLLIKYLHLNYLFDAIKNKAETRSVTQRIQRWIDAIELFKLHPIVGIGQVVGTYFPAVDNEYILILRNYGILGLLGHMCFYAFVYIKTIKDIFRKDKGVVSQQYAFAVNCSIVAVMVSNITMATFYHWRNFILLLIVCCMWAKSRDVDRQLEL